jgi:hypothetical protein
MIFWPKVASEPEKNVNDSRDNFLLDLLLATRETIAYKI